MVLAVNDSPLHVIGGIGLDNAATSYVRGRALRKSEELTDQQVIGQKLENMSARDKSRLESLVLASAELKPYLDAGDTDGARKALQSRRSWLGGRIAKGEEVDTRETDEALAMLDKNPQQLKQIVDQTYQLGHMLGAFKNNYTGGGDTGRLMDRLKAENPKMTDMQLLEAIKGGASQAGKNAVNINTGAQANEALETGTQIAKQKHEPRTAELVAERRIVGEDRGKNIVNLPGAEGDAEYSTKLLDDLVAHPGMEYAVGKSSVLPIVPGTEPASFLNRLKQVEGRQFLEAFESLKGGGAITQIEGEKATQAIARLQRSNTEQEFKDAALELKGIISRGVERMRAKAGQEPDSALPVVDGASPGMTLPGANTQSQWRATPSGVKYRVSQ